MPNENEEMKISVESADVKEEDVSLDEVNEALLSEEDALNNESEEPAVSKGDDDGKKPQTREQDAEFARKRREAEAKAKAEKLAKEQEERNHSKEYRRGQIDALKKNPYTDEPIEDEYDLQAYELMKELDDQGIDPVKGYAKELASRKRKEEAQAKASEEEKAKETKRIYEEVADLRKAHPEVDTATLATNPEFQAFAKNKFGRWTMTEIYEAFAGRSTSETKKTSSPSSAGTAVRKSKSILDMSDEEYLEWRMKTKGY